MRDAEALPTMGSLELALAAARDACAASAASRGVGIEIADIQSIQIGLDTDRLTLVLVNLIDNAVKHGRPGGGVFVTVDASDRRMARVIVDDDGPGIADADSQRVFALGKRASTTADGSGIGLALVRLLVERAGGRVDVSASPLGGARFVITMSQL
jgi:signal transduction histidine kinase